MVIEKTRVRDEMRARRKVLSEQQRELAAASMIRNLLAEPFMRNVSRVLCYCSYGGEMDTLALMRALLDEGRCVCLPVVVGHGVMHAHRLTSTDALVRGRYGVLVPARSDPVLEEPQVSLCPGFAFTERGDRIGSGHGYYDRYLSSHRAVTPIGLAYQFQVVPELPAEPFDVRMRYVVTDARVIDCGK